MNHFPLHQSNKELSFVFLPIMFALQLLGRVVADHFGLAEVPCCLLEPVEVARGYRAVER